MTVEDEKKRLRKRMRALRLVADQKDGPGAARGVMVHLLAAVDKLGIGPSCVVAGYWPIVTELDDRPLLARLHERGAICALPVVVSADAPLVFRRWSPLDELEPGVLGTSHPLLTAPEVVPDVVLAPLLAFDAEGSRLGQGGGTTIERWPPCGPVARSPLLVLASPCKGRTGCRGATTTSG